MPVESRESRLNLRSSMRRARRSLSSVMKEAEGAPSTDKAGTRACCAAKRTADLSSAEATKGASVLYAENRELARLSGERSSGAAASRAEMLNRAYETVLEDMYHYISL